MRSGRKIDQRRNLAVAVALVSWGWVLAGSGLTEAPTLAESRVPHSQWTPEQVVRLQLEALQENDPHDAGIAECYRFAAPVNRLYTGPLERFTEMLHSEAYAPLLNHRAALVGRPKIQDDHALVLVTLADRQRQPAVYMFLLARQELAPYLDCWMTTGVSRLEVLRAASAPYTSPGEAAP